MNDAFTRAASAISKLTGRPVVFMLALGSVIVWLVSGPIFDYSERWQLIINTSTTIVTFLMVFLLQNTQNRNDMALHIKLDELLRALDTARTSMVNVEEAPEEKLHEYNREFKSIRHETNGENEQSTVTGDADSGEA